MNTVVPFSKLENKTIPNQNELVKLTHELAKESENIRFEAPHAQLRLQERNISIRQVLEVLRNGHCVSGPTQDKYGDWRIKLRRMVAGKRVQVVVAVKKTYLEVITVM
jgi:hypothetical protein